MFFKPKFNLVRFENGTYGVRRTHLFYVDYLDFHSGRRLYWPRENKFFNDCQTSEEEARALFKQITLGEVIID